MTTTTVDPILHHAGHVLRPVRILPDVPLRTVRRELSMGDQLAGRDHACTHHRHLHDCPQGQRCIGRGRTEWGALVWLRSVPLGGGAAAVTGMARLDGSAGWVRVTPDLTSRQWEEADGWPLDWSRRGELTGRLAGWLNGLVEARRAER